MSFLLSSLDSLSFLFPYLIAAGAVLFGINRNKAAKVEKENAKVMEGKANAEMQARQTSENMLDVVIKSQNKGDEAIKKAVKDAETNRDHFTK